MMYVGNESKEALNAAVNLSNVFKAMGSFKEAEDILLSSLDLARLHHGERSSLTATILNNLGLLLKQDEKRLRKARGYYEEALRIREDSLGIQHPDTIISMNNMAELHIALGEEEQAKILQEKILELVGAAQEEEREVKEVNTKLNKEEREFEEGQSGPSSVKFSRKKNHPQEWKP